MVEHEVGNAALDRGYYNGKELLKYDQAGIDAIVPNSSSFYTVWASCGSSKAGNHRRLTITVRTASQTWNSIY